MTSKTQVPTFRAAVSGLAGSHPLDLARQFADRNLLAAYYTSLPESRTSGVPPALVHRHLALLLPIHGLVHGWAPLAPQRLQELIDHEFDRWASRRVVQGGHEMHAVAGLGLRRGAPRNAASSRWASTTVAPPADSRPSRHARRRRARWHQPSPQSETANIEQENKESNLIVVPSRRLRHLCRSRRAGVQLAFVPYGVDSDALVPSQRPMTSSGFCSSKRSQIRKRLRYLLEAVRGLDWRGAELTLKGSRRPNRSGCSARIAAPSLFRWCRRSRAGD